MNEHADHRAMFRYIYSIRAKGNLAPDHALPPGAQTKTPYIEFVLKICR